MAGGLSGMGDVLAQSGVSIPKLSFSSSPWMLYAGIGFMFAIIVAIGLYFLMDYLKWNQTIVVYKKINGRFKKIGIDKGMFQRVGKAGDYWLITKKFKKRLPRPKIYVDKNLIWYWERSDGEWINFELPDIDEEQNKAKAYFVDEDMRLQRLGIQKNLNDRLVKVGFWAQYGQTIMTILFVLIVTICLVVLFNNLKDIPPALTDSAKAVRDMALAIKDSSNCVSASTGVALG